MMSKDLNHPFNNFGKTLRNLQVHKAFIGPGVIFNDPVEVLPMIRREVFRVDSRRAIEIGSGTSQS